MKGKAMIYAAWACLLMLLLAMNFLVSHPVSESPAFSQPGRFVPDCWHVYDNGYHHEWADCMGVRYYE